MKIAVEGCAHGELEKIYNCIEFMQEKNNIKIDLLICCGDFQAVRNKSDLLTMAVPDKYRDMCSFYKYYIGELVAPVLTIFIGGNHEASNYLQELPYGGWVAPNIYYLGRAGVVQFGNLRIGGISGIFKGQDYLQGLWECVPYTANSMRSVYHVRSLDVFRLSQLKEKVHVMLSHDWPQGITDYGDKENLLSRKPFFREEVESNKLGSAPAKKLLLQLQPEYWFAAHLHCQFVALVKHESGQETKFLALDKCLPKRRHLQIVDVSEEFDGDKKLKFDAEWLAVLKNTNHLMAVKNVDCHMPGPGCGGRYDFTPTEEEKEAVVKLLEDMTINVDSFVRTAPCDPQSWARPPSEPFKNQQTVYLCEKLGIDDPVNVVMARAGRSMQSPQHVSVVPCNSVCESSEITEPDESLDLSISQEMTPSRVKMSLPTPKASNDIHSSQHEDSTTVISPESTSQLSESVCSTTATCSTPTSEGPKKTFKRRNLAMYTPEADVDDSVSSSSIVSSETPKNSKLIRDSV